MPSGLVSVSLLKSLLPLFLFVVGVVSFGKPLFEAANRGYIQNQQNPCPINLNKKNVQYLLPIVGHCKNHSFVESNKYFTSTRRQGAPDKFARISVTSFSLKKTLGFVFQTSQILGVILGFWRAADDTR